MERPIDLEHFPEELIAAICDLRLKIAREFTEMTGHELVNNDHLFSIFLRKLKLPASEFKKDFLNKSSIKEKKIIKLSTKKTVLSLRHWLIVFAILCKCYYFCIHTFPINLKNSNLRKSLKMFLIKITNTAVIQLSNQLHHSTARYIQH